MSDDEFLPMEFERLDANTLTPDEIAADPLSCTACKGSRRILLGVTLDCPSVEPCPACLGTGMRWVQEDLR